MGDPIGGSLAISQGATNYYPSVAYDQHTKRYLVAWNRADEIFPEKNALQGQLLDPIGQAAGSIVPLAPGETMDFFARPTVVARNHRAHAAGEVSFAVSYKSTSTSAGNLIKVVRVSGTGAPLGTSLIAAGSGPGLGYDPLFDRFLVGYSRDGSVYAKTLTAAGVVAGAATTVSTAACGSRVSVAFDAASQRYLAVHTVLNAANTCDLRAALLGHNATPALLGSVLIEAGSGTVTHSDHGVGAETGTFVVGYITETRENNQNTYVARSRRLRADGLLLGLSDWGPAFTAGDYVPVAAGVHGSTPVAWLGPMSSPGWMTQLGMGERWFARAIHAHGDLDGDGRSDLFVYQPHTDLLIARTQSATTSQVFSVPGAVPALLDWDGDDRTDRCVWEPGTGAWWLFESSTNDGYTVTLGKAGDIPVPGDYLGLGRDQIAVFRPSNGTWYIRATRFGGHLTTLAFGQVGDLPVPADWDGDGDIEPGIFRPSTGVWSAVQLDGTPVTIPATTWGGAGDVPLAGNFVGDATADQVVYRRQLGIAWIRDGATGATSTLQIGDGLPMPLDWDGDGYLNPALFDPESGLWRIRVGAQMQTVTFGGIGDIPAGR
jgi:hypothetical protein